MCFPIWVINYHLARRKPIRLFEGWLMFLPLSQYCCLSWRSWNLRPWQTMDHLPLLIEFTSCQMFSIAHLVFRLHLFWHFGMVQHFWMVASSVKRRPLLLETRKKIKKMLTCVLFLIWRVTVSITVPYCLWCKLSIRPLLMPGIVSAYKVSVDKEPWWELNRRSDEKDKSQFCRDHWHDCCFWHCSWLCFYKPTWTPTISYSWKEHPFWNHHVDAF